MTAWIPGLWGAAAARLAWPSPPPQPLRPRREASALSSLAATLSAQAQDDRSVWERKGGAGHCAMSTAAAEKGQRNSPANFASFFVFLFLFLFLFALQVWHPCSELGCGLHTIAHRGFSQHDMLRFSYRALHTIAHRGLLWRAIPHHGLG